MTISPEYPIPPSAMIGYHATWLPCRRRAIHGGNLRYANTGYHTGGAMEPGPIPRLERSRRPLMRASGGLGGSDVAGDESDIRIRV